MSTISRLNFNNILASPDAGPIRWELNILPIIKMLDLCCKVFDFNQMGLQRSGRESLYDSASGPLTNAFTFSM